ncbi:uncharacterized protein OCT59_008645 [Rhizophagus irregularis]|uniref:Uncharacterized protein n=1 Tax=Rhizophagus irregularis (strain DAOM 181602 / DAOM 197198 / MUCL 43194) TaxID=747089 RepID=U9UH24_RHIID|nr:hypothetical protein OCT59_008645 [Rhizophagus irregularis]GBC29497.2 hypothetical protein GLOIN_2v1815863 [Rhizophagus irregularis DAOM 181602=DAOM 197198]
MTTRNQKLTEKALKEMVEGNSLAEEEIVNMIKKWRIREKDAYSENSDESEGDLEFNILEESVSKPLKRGNAATDEVVDIVKELRANKDMKIKYARYKVPTNEEDDKIPKLREKITELEEIFEAVNNEIEWEKIQAEAATIKIISLAEQNEILQEYTTLNNDFQKRLDENYMTDEREIGEKRPILESPWAENSKRKEEKTEKNKKKKKDQ